MSYSCQNVKISLANHFPKMAVLTRTFVKGLVIFDYGVASEGERCQSVMLSE